MPVTFLLSLLGGCNLAEEPCEADIAAWADEDGDGFGGESLGKVCKLDEGQVEVAQDCDDADEARNPAAVEACDAIDNDCDGAVDDGADDLRQWWFDGDGDTYGGLYRSQLACQSPGAEWVRNADDCDDQNPAVNPDAVEVCGQLDEDCDGYIDEADDSVDPASFSQFYADRDGDGFGSRSETISQCRLIPGYVLEGNDCDDSSASITQKAYFADLDGDGYGDPATLVMGCSNPPPDGVENGDDCDDTDATLLYETDWFSDVDGDGFGAGSSLAFACAQPSPYAVSAAGDCDETSNLIHPDASDVCEDGIDQDCSGSDAPCGPLGSYFVNDGPPWTTDPPVYSCVEACAALLGGSATDYQCSTSATVVNNLAYLSGWGDATYCSIGRAEDYSFEQAGNPGYNCGFSGCAYSAYIQDNCGSTVRNYCYAN